MKKSGLCILILIPVLAAACMSNNPAPIPTETPTLQPSAAVTTISSPTASPTMIPEAAEDIPEPTPTDAVLFQRPFPQHTQYAQGSILPNHRSQEQLDQDVRNFYDEWKASYVVQDGMDANGNLLYRIAFGKSEENRANTVSEGQGFGMIILPVMAGYEPQAQEIFDGLWRFAQAHPSEVDSRLMDWSLSDSEGNDSAFDGDADMALGLLMADAQWGSQGAIDYRSEAISLIQAIEESTIGPESLLPTLGDWVDFDGEEYNQYTLRSSDLMLVNFRAYKAVTDDPIWDQVIINALEVLTGLQMNYSPQTGLIPDFIVMDSEIDSPHPAPEDFLEGPTDRFYYYNAGRVPWRIGEDALLSGDAVSTLIVSKISHWAEASSEENPLLFRSGYDLQGNPLDGSAYFSTFFVSPLGVAAMSSPDQQEWLNDVYDSVYLTHEEYYADAVNLLCLITMTGNAWSPD